MSLHFEKAKVNSAAPAAVATVPTDFFGRWKLAAQLAVELSFCGESPSYLFSDSRRCDEGGIAALPPGARHSLTADD